MTQTAPDTREIPAEDWHQALAAARDEGFSFFDWLSAVDATDAEEAPGFDVVCHLLALGDRTGDPPPKPGREPGDPPPKPGPGLRRLLLRTRVPDGAAVVASCTDLWRGAAWHERETHEMFGIDFTGFDDGTGAGLRPLLLPDGFEGTPLRKSFVLVARASKPWPGAKDPGESAATTRSPSRRRLAPPGVPDPSWGPG